MRFLLIGLGAVLALFVIINLSSETLPQETGSIEIYFCPETNCTQLFLSVLGEGSRCVFYDMRNTFANALRDKGVELLIHAENYEGYGTRMYGKGLLHHKFCVTNTTVITGSFNPTLRGETVNNNNVVILNSSLIAQNYRTEWTHLAEGSDEKTPYPRILLNGVLVETYFCPRDHCQDRVVETLQHAQSSIDFLVFSFTDDRIGKLLVSKANTIRVRGVQEKTQNNPYNEFARFQDAGLPILWDARPATMHHKVFLVDNTTVITGSYNPTRNGNEFNNENVLILHHPEIARVFLNEFVSLYDTAQQTTSS